MFFVLSSRGPLNSYRYCHMLTTIFRRRYTPDRSAQHYPVSGKSFEASSGWMFVRFVLTENTHSRLLAHFESDAGPPGPFRASVCANFHS